MAKSDKYSFGELTQDERVNALFREVQDNYPAASALEDLSEQIKTIDDRVPKAADLKDGAKCIAKDGADYKLYLKTGGKLFSLTLTEV